MSDQPPGPSQVPATLGASALQVNATPVSILLALGNSRLALSPEPWKGQPPSQLIDWGWVFQLSPEFARQLRDALTDVLAAYEAQFGKIPNAPEPSATGAQVLAFTPRLVEEAPPSEGEPPPAFPRSDPPAGPEASPGPPAPSPSAPTARWPLGGAAGPLAPEPPGAA